MFACPLFRDLDKNSKLKGTNIDTIPTLIGIVCCVGCVWFKFAKIKGVKIISHVKSRTFRAAKLQGIIVYFVKTSFNLLVINANVNNFQFSSKCGAT